MRLQLFWLISLWTCSLTAAQEILPHTQPLTLQGDLSAKWSPASTGTSRARPTSQLESGRDTGARFLVRRGLRPVSPDEP